MALSEEFEVVLKEVVNAKRLSASKMTNLTDIAMKNMEHDTQLVSILYRTHKSLLTTAAKVSSLYVFDALSRAAKHHSTKHGLSGDAFTQPGNSASFLFKIGGVAEGLYQDMMLSGSAEAKEKAKKVLDIWVKGNTFPSAILSRLSDVLKGPEKVPDSKAAITADPRIPNQPSHPPPPPPPSTSQSPIVMGLDPQAALLALLTQAAASSGNLHQLSQTATNIGSPLQLDPAQLAVIQQLAHTAASVPSVSQSLIPPVSVNVQNFRSSSGVNGSSHNLPSFRNEPSIVAKSKQKYSGYLSPERESRPDPHFDEPDNMRGRYRGAYRNRGRGDKFQERNWDVRDRDRYRDSDRDQSPSRTGRGGRSRSRSPPSRYGGRKDSRYFSPTRKAQASSSGQNEPGKDEFGRDIRGSGSPASRSVVDNKSPSLNSATLTHSSPPISPPSPLAVASNPNSNHDPKIVSSLVSMNTSSNTPSPLPTTNSTPVGLGMENFNPLTFDYTSPASWEALGKMWQVTHGYLPSYEQIFAMLTGNGQSDPAPEIANQNFETGRFLSRGNRGSYRGRGGNMHVNGRDMQERGRDFEDRSQTDAIVLGGGDVQSENTQNITVNGAQDNPSTTNPSSGRMQRIGDKWVFVRGVEMDVS